MKITRLAYLGTFILVVAFSTSAVSQVPSKGKKAQDKESEVIKTSEDCPMVKTNPNGKCSEHSSGMMKGMKGGMGNMMKSDSTKGDGHSMMGGGHSMMGGGNSMMGGGHSMMGGGNMMKSDSTRSGMSSMHGNKEGGHGMMKDMCPMMGGSGTAMHKGDKNTGDKKPQIKKDKKDSRL